MHLLLLLFIPFCLVRLLLAWITELRNICEPFDSHSFHFGQIFVYPQINLFTKIIWLTVKSLVVAGHAHFAQARSPQLKVKGLLPCNICSVGIRSCVLSSHLHIKTCQILSNITFVFINITVCWSPCHHMCCSFATHHFPTIALS